MNGKIQVFRTYIQNVWGSKFFKVFLWDVLSKGADFALLPVYLAILSQQEYGFYTFAIYIITTASGIIKLGLDTSASKMYYEKDKYHTGKMLFSVNAVWVIFFSFLLLAGTLTGADNFIMTKLMNISNSNFNIIKFPVYLFILFNLLQSALNVFFVIDNNPLIYQKYNLIRTIAGNLLVILVLLFFPFNNKAYLRLYAEPVIFLTAFVPLIFIFIKRISFNIDWAAIKHGLYIGLPMMGSLLVGVVYNLSDKYFLQKANGYNTLAVYNLSIFLTLPVSLIFMSFNTVWLPKFFQEKSPSVNFSKSNKHFFSLSIFYLGLMACMEIAIILAIKLKMISAEYSVVAILFPFVFISKIAETLSQLYLNFVIKWSKTFFSLLVSIIFSVVTLLLNYSIIPVWGLRGTVFVLFGIAVTRLLTFYFFVQNKIKHASVTIT